MLKTSSPTFVCLLFAVFSLVVSLKVQNTDKQNDALIVKFKSPDHRVQDVAFSPDGKLIAAGYGYYDDGGITVWNIANKSIVAAPLGTKYKSGIERVAFSSDGKLLAAASDRGDVLLWTVSSWRSPKTVLTKRGDTTDLSFSPDGEKIAVEDGKTYIVPLSKVPTPMRAAFQFPWRLEIVNADLVANLKNSPVVFQNWSIESGAGADRARVAEFKLLLPDNHSSKIKSDYIIFGAVQNPGWNEGYVAKLFADGGFARRTIPVNACHTET